MRETKKMRKVTSIPPANKDRVESARASQDPGAKDLFGKDRLKPLRSAAESDHQRLIKKPVAVYETNSEKTTRSLPKTKTGHS
jgi:hypothetical protein